MNHDELRQLWIEYFRESDRISKILETWPGEKMIFDPKKMKAVFIPGPKPPERPPFPDVLRGLTCGAKTRKGTPCKLEGLYNNGRCKLHGGLSTGPRTKKGKGNSSKNGKIPKKKRIK